MNEKLRQSIINVNNALERLNRALRETNHNELVIDGTIQRFEFCIELYWKMLRRVLLEEGIETFTPREAIQRAYQAKWLDDELLWLNMLRDRNQTSYTYDEELANEIYSRVKSYHEAMKNGLIKIEKRWSSIE